MSELLASPLPYLVPANPLLEPSSATLFASEGLYKVEDVGGDDVSRRVLDQVEFIQ